MRDLEEKMYLAINECDITVNWWMLSWCMLLMPWTKCDANCVLFIAVDFCCSDKWKFCTGFRIYFFLINIIWLSRSITNESNTSVFLSVAARCIQLFRLIWCHKIDDVIQSCISRVYNFFLRQNIKKKQYFEVKQCYFYWVNCTFCCLLCLNRRDVIETTNLYCKENAV